MGTINTVLEYDNQKYLVKIRTINSSRSGYNSEAHEENQIRAIKCLECNWLTPEEVKEIYGVEFLMKLQEPTGRKPAGGLKREEQK